MQAVTTVVPYPREREDSEFYAVYNGRVDKPTIYSSWAHAHPRVTECNFANHKKFSSFRAAWRSMKRRGFTDVEVDLRALDAAEEKKILQSPRGDYYAVAYGKNAGIFKDWTDAKAAVEGVDSACHQRFDTELEARRFIEEWKDAHADTWRREIRKALDQQWLGTKLGARFSTKEWKDTYADLWRGVIREKLDDGWEFKDMKFDTGGFVPKEDEGTGEDDEPEHEAGYLPDLACTGLLYFASEEEYEPENDEASLPYVGTLTIAP
ncbi:hypothetical protein FQN55_008368 [Onygenales sp. PD_40]|nr:hypothetical protein FQN55_008368 [Onygenales sp. PD_40]KAK2776096.1 hypothetical protein FQN52_003828 [Onygenales sp. PD_12]KAK2787152.1 hypothetical protein FQN51_003446 [Onygenales sp. PD_10]KAK2790972.1 hypothetical protein FQN53_007159 [Emmonsiellopsis sp. PD_33]